MKCKNFLIFFWIRTTVSQFLIITSFSNNPYSQEIKDIRDAENEPCNQLTFSISQHETEHLLEEETYQVLESEGEKVSLYMQ